MHKFERKKALKKNLQKLGQEKIIAQIRAKNGHNTTLQKLYQE